MNNLVSEQSQMQEELDALSSYPKRSERDTIHAG